MFFLEMFQWNLTCSIVGSSVVVAVLSVLVLVVVQILLTQNSSVGRSLLMLGVAASTSTLLPMTRSGTATVRRRRRRTRLSPARRSRASLLSSVISGTCSSSSSSVRLVRRAASSGIPSATSTALSHLLVHVLPVQCSQIQPCRQSSPTLRYPLERRHPRNQIRSLFLAVLLAVHPSPPVRHRLTALNRSVSSRTQPGNVLANVLRTARFSLVDPACSTAAAVA